MYFLGHRGKSNSEFVVCMGVINILLQRLYDLWMIRDQSEHLHVYKWCIVWKWLIVAHMKYTGFKSQLFHDPACNALCFEYNVLLCIHLLYQVCTAKPYDASDCRIFAKGNAGYIGLLQPCSSPCTSEVACTSSHNSGSSGSATCEGKHLIVYFAFCQLEFCHLWQINRTKCLGPNNETYNERNEVSRKRIKLLLFKSPRL